MKIQLERWDTFYPDCMPLFAAHTKELDAGDERAPHDPNIEMFSALDKAGLMQILTARDNSKLIGYCMFNIGFSLESKNLLCGTLMPFFVQKEYRGSLGIKLFLRSIEALKARGVKQVFVHHYTTSNSPKLKKFFERLGARPVQHEYSIWVGE